MTLTIALLLLLLLLFLLLLLLLLSLLLLLLFISPYQRITVQTYCLNYLFEPFLKLLGTQLSF